MPSAEMLRKAENAKSLPTTEQMFCLAAMCVCLAKSDGSFKESRRRSAAHIFLSHENEAIELPDESGMRFSIHKLKGRVARTDYRRWRMRIFEDFTVRGIDDEGAKSAENIDWYQQNYTFEWTDKDIILAARKMDTKQEKDSAESVLPEVLDDTFFEPDVLHFANEFTYVSMADCEQLMADIRLFRSALRQPLVYNR